MSRGFTALEALVARRSTDGRHCCGASVTLADVCLVPQMYNARRARLDLAPYPRLNEISACLESLPPFAAARPEAQPDAEQLVGSV
jgi:glutathione S-transferase